MQSKRLTCRQVFDERLYLFCLIADSNFENLLSVQIFQADVFVLHMHILATMELQAKEPFGPARVVFQFSA
jgi:hypothetical protein